MNYAIILAGGEGKRFWPFSRTHLPKQFLNIFGKDTFFKATFQRAAAIIPKKNIFIITNRTYLGQIKQQIEGLGISQTNVVFEPKPLNTLPAIAFCTQLINLADREAKILVFPADHYIGGIARFKHAVSVALNLSSKGLLCLFGIKPDSSCCGYGHIRIGRSLGKGIFRVRYFIEKPDAKKAKKLYRQKDIFWNSGMFCFKAEVFLKELKLHQPQMYAQINRVGSKQDIKKIWNNIKPISIDYGLLEKTKNLGLITSYFYWRDLGSWDALYKELAKDKNGNSALSDTVNLDTANIFVAAKNPKKLIATIGLRDTIIVDTPDALLVCKKERSEEIKKLVEILRKQKKKCV
jgi:mannose-1-phosphate guanylyltransferase/mannose-6-phosphate isomerase